MLLRHVTLDELTIDDDAILSKIAVYRGLKRHLKQVGYRFQIAEPPTTISWDRALFLNLTFWSPQEGADVLCDDHLAADVLAHVALHQLVNAKLADVSVGHAPTASALFFGESIASAFDLYLVGRLMETAPDSDFITTQVPIMSDAALQAGLSEDEFVALIEGVQQDPERAFEDMRVLLLDVSLALLECQGIGGALEVLNRFADHRFASLLHHLQLSNWILYARAHAKPHAAQDEAVRTLDQTLRAAPSSLDWLAKHWIPSSDT